MCESRSKPEPNPLLGRLARRATPRSLPKSRVRKLTMRSPSLNGQVCRTKASLTRAGIETEVNGNLKVIMAGFAHGSASSGQFQRPFFMSLQAIAEVFGTFRVEEAVLAACGGLHIGGRKNEPIVAWIVCFAFHFVQVAQRHGGSQSGLPGGGAFGLEILELLEC